jgi:hypothetical protein
VTRGNWPRKGSVRQAAIGMGAMVAPRLWCILHVERLREFHHNKGDYRRKNRMYRGAIVGGKGE